MKFSVLDANGVLLTNLQLCDVEHPCNQHQSSFHYPPTPLRFQTTNEPVAQCGGGSASLCGRCDRATLCGRLRTWSPLQGPALPWDGVQLSGKCISREVNDS